MPPGSISLMAASAISACGYRRSIPEDRSCPWRTLSPSERCYMESVVTDAGHPLRDTHFMWLEITSNCQLECSHCYAESGPGQGHGIVSADQWMQTLTEAAAAGVQE